MTKDADRKDQDIKLRLSAISDPVDGPVTLALRWTPLEPALQTVLVMVSVFVILR
jgi:hypothetical protein